VICRSDAVTVRIRASDAPSPALLQEPDRTSKPASTKCSALVGRGMVVLRELMWLDGVWVRPRSLGLAVRCATIGDYYSQ
jgi:hypothetical protein